MMGLTGLPLEAGDQMSLDLLQTDVNASGDYAEQVAAAKAGWRAKPAELFVRIRGRLQQMCSGNARCVYCEDSYADEIEHMRPKDLYPEQTFQWANFVFACGPCNGSSKVNRFAVVRHDGTAWLRLDVTRLRRARIIPPEAGGYALIDPRCEDPIDYLWLDFETGRYSPNSDDPGSLVSLRAQYTIDVLRLNARDALARGRRSAHRTFHALLDRWLQQHAQWDDRERRNFVDAFRAQRYRSVWEHMKRRRAESPELNELLHAAPEALAW